MVEVDTKKLHVDLNGLRLSPRDLRDILVAFGGRGVMLDFEGYDGGPPKWLTDEVLTPTGYVGEDSEDAHREFLRFMPGR